MKAAHRTTLAALIALVGFAANSLLCRAALGSHSIDACSFTCVRLGSGALALFLLARLARVHPAERAAGSWPSALALFVYAAAFSLAYLRLSTGIGALVLFACVQTTMIGWSIKSRERPSAVEWTGVTIALAGLALLTLPGASAPDPIGLLLMVLAGIGWGVYSLRGRASHSPLAATADNFARSVPLALAGLGLALALGSTHASARGIGLACVSGAIASGLGYSLWYLALPGLTVARAAVIQLVVPVLAAGAGILLLGEHVTARLVIAGAMILGGVGTAVLLRRTHTAAGPRSAIDTSLAKQPER